MARDLSTPEAVCAAIRALYEERRREPVPWLTINRRDPELVKAAERHFKIWGNAVVAAGLALSVTHTNRIG